MFALQKHHGFSEEMLEMKYPFERDLTVQMVMDYMKQIEEKRNSPNVTQSFSPSELARAGVDISKFKPGELEAY